MQRTETMWLIKIIRYNDGTRETNSPKPTGRDNSEKLANNSFRE